jgi:hypothetical protein
VNSGGEKQGLLPMAFAPDYATSGRVYVDYTSANGDIHVVGDRRSGRNPGRASAGTARPRPGHARGDRSTGLSVGAMSSFGQDTAGHVHALSLSGQVYRLAG